MDVQCSRGGDKLDGAGTVVSSIRRIQCAFCVSSSILVRGRVEMKGGRRGRKTKDCRRKGGHLLLFATRPDNSQVIAIGMNTFPSISSYVHDKVMVLNLNFQYGCSIL